jgi:signal transduction histidine kinase
MHNLRRIFHQGPRSAVLFAGIILLPAFALGLLAVRTFQTEKVREEYQRRERQQQILRLLETDLGNWILSRRGKPGENAFEFEVQQNRIFLTRLNVYVSTDYERPAAPQLSSRDTSQWRDAQAIEFRGGKPEAAIQSYQKLLSGNALVASWSKLALLRLGLQRHASSDAALWLREIQDTDQAAMTESGIPIRVAAALLLIDHGGTDPLPGTAGFLNRALSQLAGGCWPLNAAQWTYYVREICPSLNAASDSCTEALETARLLESFAGNAREVLALDQSLQWRTDQQFAAHSLPDRQNVLIMFSDKDRTAGCLISSADLVRKAEATLAGLTAAEDFEGLISFTRDNTQSAAVSLPAFPFLTVSFPERHPLLWLSHLRRYSLLYATALILFGAGVVLLFTYRAVAREMDVSRMKTEFVSSVSHEFRTPLSAIEALLERLESGKVRDEEMLHRYYRASRREVQRLTAMVNQLLDFSRLKEGREEFSYETIDLNRLAEEALQSFSNLGFEKRLEENLHNDKPLNISADKDAVYQCIHNLIDNALKYSPDGSQVTVGSGKQDSEIFLRVSDCGPGIAPEERELIFEQFYRAKRSDDQGIQGAGIGLALVKKVMRAHGGKVTLESRVGEGSTFKLTFPEVTS